MYYFGSKRHQERKGDRQCSDAFEHLNRQSPPLARPNAQVFSLSLPPADQLFHASMCVCVLAFQIPSNKCTTGNYGKKLSPILEVCSQCLEDCLDLCYICQSTICQALTPSVFCIP